MSTELFERLEKEKREKIINAGIEEFAGNDYDSSSTNRIVQNVGISKGSLFKYFQNKEDFYFYLIDLAAGELNQSMEQKMGQLPEDIFERVIIYSEFELTWYVMNPVKYQLIMRAFTKNPSEIYEKTERRYGLEAQSIFQGLLEGVDWRSSRWDKETTTNLLQWFLTGFNQEYRNQISLQEKKDLNLIRQHYTEELTKYLNVLKLGMAVPIRKEEEL